ncbi:MAG: dihydrodipicolinate reductase [Pseudomonadota bacterium]
MTYKVFQWASGTVGRHAARVALERASLQLIGLHTYSQEKAGLDVGELLDRPSTGIAVTTDISAILASDADVVIHTPLPSLVYGDNPEQDVEDFCTLLAAGKNVITAVGYMYPKVHGQALVDRLEAACAQGNSSFHSTGLNPGWLGDLVPLTMSGLCETIDQAIVLEISSFEMYPSPEIMFGSMGFNSTPEDFARNNARRANWLNGLFAESVQMTADGMGLNVTEIVSNQDLALAEEDLETASGTVAKGTVAGQHWRWAGVDADGVERMIHETVWRMHSSVAPDWPQGNHAITFHGSPEMHLEFPPNFGMSDGLLGTAMHAVNAIPYVVKAPPGIQTFLDLPWIMFQR